MKCPICHEGLYLVFEERYTLGIKDNEVKRTWECRNCGRRYEDIINDETKTIMKPLTILKE